MTAMTNKVIVIGAGPAGISSVKELTYAGYDVICIDSQEQIGGVWNWAWDGVLMTTSSVMSAFSDFPPELPSKIWTKEEYQSYLIRYAEHFKIRDKFHLGQQVQHATRVLQDADHQSGDASSSWVWQVKTIDKKNKQEKVHHASALFVCMGTNQQPNRPTYKGQDTFEGQILHTSEYRDPSIFENKSVVTVGMGESGSDLALEGAKVAKKIEFSIRGASGWVVPRDRKSVPADNLTSRALWGIPRAAGPWLSWIMAWGDQLLGETPVIRQMGQYNREVVLTNDPDGIGIFGTFGTKNNSFVQALVHNGATLKPAIKEIGPGRRVVYTDGSINNDVDLLVLNTGFFRDFSLLEAHEDDVALKSALQDALDPSVRKLWKQCLPTTFQEAKIAFVGCLFRPSFGSQTTSAEMQARLATLAIKDPEQFFPSSKEAMHLQIAIDLQNYHNLFGCRAQRKALGDHFMYMNDVASVIGAHPGSFWDVAWKQGDPLLALKLFYGPFTPAQFRLRGPGANPQAARRIVDHCVLTPRQLLGIRLFRTALFCHFTSVLYRTCLLGMLFVLRFVVGILMPRETGTQLIKLIEDRARAMRSVGMPTSAHKMSLDELKEKLRQDGEAWKTIVGDSKKGDRVCDFLWECESFGKMDESKRDVPHLAPIDEGLRH